MPARINSKKHTAKRSSKRGSKRGSKMTGGRRVVRRTSKSSKKMSKKMSKKRSRRGIKGGAKCITLTDGAGNNIKVCDDDNIPYIKESLIQQAKGNSELVGNINSVITNLTESLKSPPATPIKLSAQHWKVLNDIKGKGILKYA